MNAVSTILDADGKCSVVIYPDELPRDGSLVSDALLLLYAPLTAWRQIAVEYFRQDMVQEFRSILEVIVNEIEKQGELLFSIMNKCSE